MSTGTLRRLAAYDLFDLERIVDDAGTLYVGELVRWEADAR